MTEPSTEPASLFTSRGHPADENEPICDYDGPPAPETDEFGYRIHEHPMGEKKKMKVIFMGAGASAMHFLKKAEEQMENLDIVCYEKNHDIGGTWLENRYPGMFLYQYRRLLAQAGKAALVTSPL